MVKLSEHIDCREFTEARKLIIISEKSKTYRLTNITGYKVERWKIDGCIFKNETACDDLLLIFKSKEEDEGLAYWIEMKGSDIEHAAFQILSTIMKVEVDFERLIHHARIIPSKVPTPNLTGTKYRTLIKFIKKNNGEIKLKNKLLQETI